MGKTRAYSATPSITSGDRCRASLPVLDLLFSMGAGGGPWEPQATGLMTAALGRKPHKPSGQIPCQQYDYKQTIRDCNVPSLSCFPARYLYNRLSTLLLLNLPTAVVVEEVSPYLRFLSAPQALIIISYSETLEICCGWCMPALQLIVSCC
jgi:hypothetical protein